MKFQVAVTPGPPKPTLPTRSWGWGTPRRRRRSRLGVASRSGVWLAGRRRPGLGLSACSAHVCPRRQRDPREAANDRRRAAASYLLGCFSRHREDPTTWKMQISRSATTGTEWSPRRGPCARCRRAAAWRLRPSEKGAPTSRPRISPRRQQRCARRGSHGADIAEMTGGAV